MTTATPTLDRTSKITTPAEFKAWAETVNTPQANNFMCDLQDIYARSNPETIRQIFTAPEHRADRRLLTFAVYKAMGEQTQTANTPPAAQRSPARKTHTRTAAAQ